MNPVSTPGGGAAASRMMTWILAILGILAVVLGLLYLFTASSLPSMLVGSVHHGRHVVRATVSIAVGLALIVFGALNSRRRPSASSQ